MQSTIFDALLEDRECGSCGKTCRESCPCQTTHSAVSWADWSAVMPPSSLHETEAGQVQAWFMDPSEAPHGASLTPSTSEWRNDGAVSLCSLVEVLEAGPLPTRFYLSSRAATGILRRAERRGKTLPERLELALREVGRETTWTDVAHKWTRGSLLAFHPRQDHISSDISMPLETNGPMALCENQSRVRKLTPRECERLQGFPDDYTAIPWKNQPADQCPDSPRYRALGNSMAVPVMIYIGEQIAGHRF